MEVLKKDVQALKEGLMALVRQTESLMTAIHGMESRPAAKPAPRKPSPPARTAKTKKGAAKPRPVKAGGAPKKDRATVIRMIADMRKKGASFEHIAQHLDSAGFPTFSGRGKWRKQTVHKIHQQLA